MKNNEEQLTMPDILSQVETRKPDHAVIKCNHRDEYVEEFVNWYALMGLKYTVVVDPFRSDIEVDLMLGEEILDQLGCPQGK